jgi:hypothetical protein
MDLLPRLLEILHPRPSLQTVAPKEFSDPPDLSVQAVLPLMEALQVVEVEALPVPGILRAGMDIPEFPIIFLAH